MAEPRHGPQLLLGLRDDRDPLPGTDRAAELHADADEHHAAVVLRLGVERIHASERNMHSEVVRDRAGEYELEHPGLERQLAGTRHHCVFVETVERIPARVLPDRLRHTRCTWSVPRRLCELAFGTL